MPVNICHYSGIGCPDHNTLRSQKGQKWFNASDTACGLQQFMWNTLHHVLLFWLFVCGSPARSRGIHCNVFHWQHRSHGNVCFQKNHESPRVQSAYASHGDQIMVVVVVHQIQFQQCNPLQNWSLVQATEWENNHMQKGARQGLMGFHHFHWQACFKLLLTYL